MTEKRPPNIENATRGCNPLILLILALLAAVIIYVLWIDNPVNAPDPAKTAPVPVDRPG